MSNPKEKAKEIVNKFYETLLKNDLLQSYNAAKQCARMAVDEIIATYTNKDKSYWLLEDEVDYWQQVKTEIEKL